MNTNYKELHEQFMSNHSGTTLLENYMLFSIVPASVFIALWSSLKLGRKTSFFVQFIMIVVPLLVTTTVLSDFVLPISLGLTCTCLFILWFYVKDATSKDIEYVLKKTTQGRSAYITNFRATISLATSLCILAVDFKIFPRKFAKTETFGCGLMDLGVGSYICANGVVHDHRKHTADITKTLKEMIPLLALGFLRLFLVKATDYHEHMTEYGVHWNFFFTLAFCKLIATSIMLIFPPRMFGITSAFVALIHELSLSWGLLNWVLSDTPRVGFLSANREGITSLFGYVAIYLASVSLGHTFQGHYVVKSKLQVLIKLIFVSFCLWMGAVQLSTSTGISRRLVNIGYIAWILAFNVTMIVHFILVDIAFQLVAQTCKMKSLTESTPALFDSINYNGLFFFLISNVLTGVVNLLCKPLFVGSMASLCILEGYLVLVCMSSVLLYKSNIKIKF